MTKRIEREKSIEETSGLWELLSLTQREYLRKNYFIRHYRKNELVYSEGDAPDALIFLTQGKVKIFREGTGGRTQIIRIIKPLEFFGYRALLAEELFVTSAAAFETSTLYFVPAKVFLTLLKENNDLAFYFIKAMAVDLGIADQRTVNLTQKHIRGRLAESLLFLKDSYGYEEDGATISIYLSREDLASLSNMTTANAIRTLAVFASEKIITVDGRKIKIMDEDALKRVSRFG